MSIRVYLHGFSLLILLLVFFECASTQLFSPNGRPSCSWDNDIEQDGPGVRAYIGIDFGQAFIKAAVARNNSCGKLEIVHDEFWERKEPSVVGFIPRSSSEDTQSELPERRFGADAADLAARNPDAVFPNLKMLLGKDLQRDAVELYSSRHPTLRFSSHGGLSFNTTLSPSGVFRIEELVAMQLKEVVRRAEAMIGGNKIVEAVLTVPAFWGLKERSALETAAELAGLRVMRLMTDGLAVGIHYCSHGPQPSGPTPNWIAACYDSSNGIYDYVSGPAKQFETSEYHLVYDMGAGSTRVTVLKMDGADASVLGYAADQELGGDTFNEEMVNLLIDEFLDTSEAKKLFTSYSESEARKSLRTNGKTAAKLWTEATRVRERLSSVKATDALVDALYNRTDFESNRLTRTGFESRINARYAGRIVQPIVDALTAAHLDISELRSIILHGGATRTPYVVKQLETLVAEHETRLYRPRHQVESAAFGAAREAARLSESFTIRHEWHSFSPSPSVHDPVATRFSGTSPDRTTMESLDTDHHSTTFKHTIFRPGYGSALRNRKIITIPHADDFEVIVAEIIPEDPTPRNKEFLVKITASNVTAAATKLIEDHNCTKSEIETRIAFIFANGGMPYVANGWVECETGTEETIEAEEPDIIRTGKATAREPIALQPIKLKKPLLTATEKSRSLRTIAEFERTDAAYHELAEARYKLESYVYSSRHHASDPAFQTATNSISMDANWEFAADDISWLNSNLHHGVAVASKFSALKELFDEVHRNREAEDIAQAWLDRIPRFRYVIYQLRLSVDGYYVPASMHQEFATVNEWLNTVEAAYSAHKTWDDPVLTSEEIGSEVVAFEERTWKTLSDNREKEWEDRQQKMWLKKTETEERKKRLIIRLLDLLEVTEKRETKEASERTSEFEELRKNVERLCELQIPM